MIKRIFSSIGLKNSWNYKKNKKLLGINLLSGGLAFSGVLIHHRLNAPVTPATLPMEVQKAEPPLQKPSLVERFAGQIERNMTFSDVLSAYKFPRQLVQELVVITKPIYNLQKLIVGNKFELERLSDGTLRQFRYEVDLDKNLKVYLTEEGYKAELEPTEYETRSEFVSGAIQNSLFYTLNELNERDQLALDLSEIFSWDIDFNTDLQPSDHFKLVVEKQYLEGEFVRYRKIRAAEFINKGKLYSAFYYTDAEGHSDYYDAEGQSLRRDFLKSPIKFSRISSKFSRNRFHPILKAYRPHLGVDYAAPSGTPVVAAGNGHIQFAGWNGGFGRFIQITHGNSLTSMYGHLSRFALGIRNGSSVKQGEVIGFVGASGLATGPHLDYRVTRNGRFVNPISIKFQPSTPVKPQYLALFQSQKEKWQSQLAAIGISKEPQVASAQKPNPDPK
jgi:murein DD-endopeptidase MepM/ murein hydrolase activator NlpD